MTLLLPQRIHAHRRHALTSALGVALAAVGCAPPGPRLAPAVLEPLRRTRPWPAQPGHMLGLLVSAPVAGPLPGVRLVLVHGTPGAAAGWGDYVHSPPPGMEVLALDRPGFGASSPGQAWPSLADQASAVAALLPDDGRRTVLLGHSLGGAVVARVAAEQPQRVAGLVLLAAALSPDLEEVHPLQRLGDWPPVRALLPRSIRHANTELLAYEAELRALQPLLARVQARVAIVHGDRDDLVPVANVAYMQARLTGARAMHTVVLAGRNHFLPWNAAAEVRAAIDWAAERAA